MKKIHCLLICLCTSFFLSNNAIVKTNAEVDMSAKGIIVVNNTKVSTIDTTIIRDDQMLIPLRTVLEILGSTVIWESSTGNIYFDFDGVVYVCKFEAPNPKFPEDKNVYICNVVNINSSLASDHFQLHTMGSTGFYSTIDNRVYLHQQTGQRMLETLGLKVDIDIEQKKLSISQ